MYKKELIVLLCLIVLALLCLACIVPGGPWEPTPEPEAILFLRGIL